MAAQGTQSGRSHRHGCLPSLVWRNLQESVLLGQIPTELERKKHSIDGNTGSHGSSENMGKTPNQFILLDTCGQRGSGSST